jgi:hypothetical protein
MGDFAEALGVSINCFASRESAEVGRPHRDIVLGGDVSPHPVSRAPLPSPNAGAGAPQGGHTHDEPKVPV